jgi:C1A family cysteine protease
MRKKSFFIFGFFIGILICIGILFNYFLVTSNSGNKNKLNSPSEQLENIISTQLLKGTGCLFKKAKDIKIPIFKFDLKDEKMNIPSSYSLEKYLPEVGDQGDVGSCVGWSTTYYGFSIVKRIENGIDYPVFAPLSIFNRFSYLNGSDPCSNGAYIEECLDLLVKKGCPYESEYNKPNCSLDPSKKKYKDCLYKFERLQHNNSMQIKFALSKNCPVIIGMNLFQRGRGNSLNSKFLDSCGVVKMDNFRDNPNRVGGHALCIVGYDDNIGGGAFKIVNSWGSSWGKEGFFWLKYKHIDVVRCAYAMFPEIQNN